jgi:hypothetical protein
VSHGWLSRPAGLARGHRGPGEGRDVGLENVEGREWPGQERPMVVLDHAAQGWREPGNRGAQASCRQLSHGGRIRPPRAPPTIGHHGGEGARGTCQHAWDPRPLTDPCVAELGPVTGALTPGARPRRGETTRVQQAAPPTLGSPAGIGLVRVTPGDVLARGRLHPQPGQDVCQPRVNRCPGLARACPRERGKARGRQPVRQGQPVPGPRATRLECRHPLARVPGRSRHQPTGRQPLLRDIHAGAPYPHHVHPTPPATRGLAGDPAHERQPGGLDVPKAAGPSAGSRQGSRSSAGAGPGHPSDHDLATSPAERLVLWCQVWRRADSFACVMVPLGHESSVAIFHLR